MSLGRQDKDKIFKFITFSERTCCSHGQVVKNITKIPHHASFHTDYFWQGGVLTSYVTIVSTF